MLDEICEISDCLNINQFLNDIPNYHVNLLCIHFNIRSLIKNFAALEQCIITSNKPIDVVILTEVNVMDNTSCLFHINGYQMFTALRKSRRGGGIIIYVSNKHKCNIKTIKTKHFENLLLTITTNSNYITNICAVYRPPSSSKNLFIDELLNLIDNYSCDTDLYLLGDINIDLKLDNPAKHKYNNMLHSLGLLCGITAYTRIELSNGRLSKSCIDHIYARSRTQDLYTAAIGTTLADHRAVIIACVGPRTQAVPTYKICLNNKKLNSLLEEIDWTPTYDMTCPLNIYNYIYTKFTECYKKSEYSIKINTKITRINNDWINNKIIKACEYRDNLFFQWIKNTNNMILKLKYNKARNNANALIQKTKNKNTKSEIISNKNNTKNLWSILNRLTGRIKSSIDDGLERSFGNNNNSSKDVANKFAVTFNNSVKQIISKCPEPLLDKKTYAVSANVSMRFRSAEPKSITKILKSLNSNKAPGVDRIRAIDVKKMCDKISLTIAKLINACILTGKYPKLLKTGIVRPIHKKGSQVDYLNYRPITILPTINKVVEKYVGTQIQHFYANNSILTCNQYGFQPHKSTTQLLSTFTDSIYNHLDKKEHILVVFVDYSRAFDTLRHDKLLQSLNDSGVRGNLLTWCENYLHDRSYQVRISNVDSFSVLVTEGTAQGSVLGPLHYLTYVNNLSNAIKQCELYQFADDTCLVATGRNIEDALTRLQSDFDILVKWSHDVGLVLNSNKTKLIYISSSKNRSTFRLKLIAHNHQCLHLKQSNNTQCNCDTIEQVSKYTYLGLVIDDRLNWKEHINHVSDKLRVILAKFSIIKSKIPYKTLLLLYKSLAESIISYGLSSYGRTSKTHLDNIFSLQLRILKKIVPIKIKDTFKDYRKLFAFCKILPIHEKVELTLLSQYYFTENLQKLHKNYSIRRQDNLRLQLPSYNNLYGKKRLNYIIPYLINIIPNPIKEKITYKNLKNILKQYFLQIINKKYT
ncbi:unnamed protein product [Parnassius mnemosyne]|uniref:Reverse transcriptase domain-containing protein n=1 Tax=Parnassius mnemosyne TaxID=213953 RepID=A0AAV1KT26_9NEOP